MIGFLFILALGLAAHWSISFLYAEVEAQSRKTCKQHTWPTKGPLECLVCKYKPTDKADDTGEY